MLRPRQQVKNVAFDSSHLVDTTRHEQGVSNQEELFYVVSGRSSSVIETRKTLQYYGERRSNGMSKIFRVAHVAGSTLV